MTKKDVLKKHDLAVASAARKVAHTAGAIVVANMPSKRLRTRFAEECAALASAMRAAARCNAST